MLLIQLTGLSGSGKTTIARGTKTLLEKRGLKVEILDGDDCRKMLFKELGFSQKDRMENIRRLGYIAQRLVRHDIIVIIAAINPFEQTRNELENFGPHVKTILINCNLDVLEARDTKDLYRRARLPDGHPDKIHNLTGVNDPYEKPILPHFVIDTSKEPQEQSASHLSAFIMEELRIAGKIDQSLLTYT